MDLSDSIIGHGRGRPDLQGRPFQQSKQSFEDLK